MTTTTGSDGPPIRQARSSEADERTELARRSKAHWGHPADFIDRYRGDLSVTAADIQAGGVRVLGSGSGRILGFYREPGRTLPRMRASLRARR